MSCHGSNKFKCSCSRRKGEWHHHERTTERANAKDERVVCWWVGNLCMGIQFVFWFQSKEASWNVKRRISVRQSSTFIEQLVVVFWRKRRMKDSWIEVWSFFKKWFWWLAVVGIGGLKWCLLRLLILSFGVDSWVFVDVSINCFSP